MNSISLYDSSNINILEWPKSASGEYSKRFLLPLVEKGLPYFIDNIHSKIYALKIDDVVLSVIDANEKPKSSYVCSPYDFYISYGLETLDILDNTKLKTGLKGLIKTLGKLGCIGKMNSVVYVNHGLFSTDLYTNDLTESKIGDIVDFLTKRFPDKAIIFRSLNPILYRELTKKLINNGFKTIATRQVQVTDACNEDLYKTRIIKSDLKLYRESPYKIIDGKDSRSDNCDEMLNLYHTLCIDQHSNLNPQFNIRFIRHLFENKVFDFKFVVKEGKICGIAGFHEKEKVLMCPLFGLNKNHPDHSTIYRLLSTALLLEAKNRKAQFHQSAGATFYKKIRRAESCIESMAIYTKHLPLRQKMTWASLRGVINIVGPKFMEKY